MENQQKDTKQFTFIYDWLQIARKTHQNAPQDIQMLMDLIDIPISSQEVSFMANCLTSENGLENKLERQNFMNFFIIPEEKKKIKEKQVLSAFKFVANNEQDIPMDNLEEYLLEQGLDENSAKMVIKQLVDFETTDNKFDYKKFVASYQDK